MTKVCPRAAERLLNALRSAEPSASSTGSLATASSTTSIRRVSTTQNSQRPPWGAGGAPRPRHETCSDRHLQAAPFQIEVAEDERKWLEAQAAVLKYEAEVPRYIAEARCGGCRAKRDGLPGRPTAGSAWVTEFDPKQTTTSNKGYRL